MTPPSLDALLKVAERMAKADVVPEEDKDDASDEEHFAATDEYVDTFNPTVARALVRVAMVAEKIATDKVSNEDGWTDEYVVLWNTLHDQLEALTAALKGSNRG